MKALTFWKTVVGDRSDFLERVIALLQDNGIRYCVIGGQAVNAYTEPVVTLDLDIVIAVEQLEHVEQLLARSFKVERFPHSINVNDPGSNLRVQLQTDPRYFDFVSRATLREVLGLELPVAAIEDVLQGKVWAASDASHRPSKRQKDLADIARILEEEPALRDRVPADILSRLVT